MDINSKDELGSSVHLDEFESKTAQHEAVGTVRLLYHNEVVLIPTPSPNPKDPLNLPQWRKWIIIVTLGLFSITSVLITSGMGAILTNVLASYNYDPRVSDLMTYPTLFMGIGNLIAMPLAMAIGRRPIFLASALLLLIGSVWCASSTSLESHIAGRNILSMAAGQSEALCPMIIQEIHFLHERSVKLAWFSAIQSIGTAALLISSTYLVQSYGWKWWYGVFGIVNGAIFILAIFFVPESRYNRPTDAFEGAVHVHEDGHDDRIMRVTTQHGVALDLDRYGKRTFKDDLQVFHGPADWKAFLSCWVQMFQCICFPNIFWVVLMNSTILGIYVVMATEYAGILVRPPYGFAFTSLGYVQTGQIVVALIMLPVLGSGGDWLNKKLAQRKNGISEPENRLIPFIIPIIVGIVSTIYFGKAGSAPEHWSSWTIIITYSAVYFGFIAIVLIGYTYALDSYPERAGPILVLICAIRGFISFGISFGGTNFVTKLGYSSALNICSIVFGSVSVFLFPLLIFGKKIRIFTTRWAVDNKDLTL